MKTLYKIDSSVAFYCIGLDYPTLRTQLESGASTGYDLNGNAMSPYEAVASLGVMSARAFGFSAGVTGSPLSEYVASNISLSPVIVSIVREEMIAVSLTALGLNALTMMNKLTPVIMAIQIGMFAEAAYILQNTATDAFLTTDRIAKYVSLLVSCNAIP